ncbi:DUF2971 domain-containing protein [Pseudoalteromonas sp. SWYJZ12]|uniref:DUF2971 domain-containing protein n=1 Tax=Pseudoalteromonas sp. SWYJZ12 TaxID=2792067 RepID=UPI0018CEED35|nr:DUF2971 domain-containing protein [Pseudoalteromonas sp. SWYJZ12]MBH0001427.1 DUF2971 domain-containing protein [Pseudoalteromonas sp. SWYJZ12]
MDSQVKNNFKNKKFASLEYLSNEKAWAEDNNNLGLYFFLLELKGKDTSEVFNKILHIKESYVSSYSYLGDIARELFNYPNERKIPTYYFKEALKHDERDSHVLWNLFALTRNTSYFLTAIKINYEAKKFDLVSYNLLNAYAPQLIQAKFDKADWQELKSIFLDTNVSHCHDFLLICYFYLDDLENGINLMNEKERVSKSIIDLYLDKGCIDFDYAVQKSYFFESVKYLEGDFKRIYEEAKKEVKKGNANPTKEAIIKYAFEAEEYSEVISLVEEEIKEPRKINNQLRLYYLLSSLYLDIELNEEYEIAINKQNFFRKYSCNPLYLAYLILKNIKVLETSLVEKDDLHPIEHWSLYQEADEYLSHDDLLNHYMHDSIVEKLKSLKDKWDKHVINIEIEKLKSTDEPLSENDKTRLASYLIDTNRHDEAPSLLTELEPSMSVSNLLAIYYERQDKVDTALTHFKSAIDSMKVSGELNDVIISNYLSCLNRSEHSIPDSLYDEYIDSFNESIAGHFRYTLSTSQNGNSLFKYYPFNQFTLDALVNGYFYLASSEQLNDPIELPYDNLSADKTNLFLRPNFRLASFSNNENSMLMWSHYAENHTGLMVEYYFEGELPDGVGIDKVNYSHTTKRYKEKERYLFNQYMLTKNKDWSYEKEVRLFAYKRDKIYYEKASYPYKTGDRAYAYIKSITVGYKFPESTIKLIQSIISGLNENIDNNLSKIELRRAMLSEKNFFELEYEVIN